MKKATAETHSETWTCLITSSGHAILVCEDQDDFLNNVETTLIDKKDPSDPERREEFCRTNLRALAVPPGFEYLRVIHTFYSFIILRKEQNKSSNNKEIKDKQKKKDIKWQIKK